MISAASAGKSETLAPAERQRVLWFLAGWLLSVVAFYRPLAALTRLALGDERYTHIAFILPVSIFLIGMRRERLLKVARFSPASGLPLLLAGLALIFLVPAWSGLGEGDRLSVAICGVFVVWMGLGALVFGVQALRQAAFPVLFLLLIIPIPANVMEQAVTALQKGSAETTAVVFKAIGMPFFRNGFTFSLPGIDIEVAEECSGIRSSLSLLLTSILAGYVFLPSPWSRLLFALLTIPVAILKNAVRIATISWLGVYVDRGFFFGNLHRYGGLPFSLLAIGMLAAIVWGLRKVQKNSVRYVGYGL